MKIELSKKQCIDIEWSILIAVDTVQQRYLKEKKIPFKEIIIKKFD